MPKEFTRNLTFADMDEQSTLYDFFDDDIIIESRPMSNGTRAQEYKQDWISYFGELQTMGNL